MNKRLSIIKKAEEQGMDSYGLYKSIIESETLDDAIYLTMEHCKTFKGTDEEKKYYLSVMCFQCSDAFYSSFIV